MEKKWLGDVSKCDLCEQPFENSCVKYTNELEQKRDFFVDGRTVIGPWALMCGYCFKQYGEGLGTGRGQMYDLETKIKIAG